MEIGRDNTFELIVFFIEKVEYNLRIAQLHDTLHDSIQDFAEIRHLIHRLPNLVQECQLLIVLVKPTLERSNLTYITNIVGNVEYRSRRRAERIRSDFIVRIAITGKNIGEHRNDLRTLENFFFDTTLFAEVRCWQELLAGCTEDISNW